MRVAIIGGGFGGLTTAYFLSKKGYEVTVFESQNHFGGLTATFRVGDSNLEYFYHHLFSSDEDILDLARALKVKINFSSPPMGIYYDNRLYPFSTAIDALKFKPLSFVNRIRFGLVTIYLKFLVRWQTLENVTAVSWAKKWFGLRIFQVIWEPLLKSKFGHYANDVAMVWLWARIKTRSQKLGYPVGGFQSITDGLLAELLKRGVTLEKGTAVTKIIRKSDQSLDAVVNGESRNFDRVIFKGPLPSFLEVAEGLPEDYRKKSAAVRFLSASALILVLKKSLSPIYWLNINDETSPFLALVEQTRFISSEKYNHQTVVYLGNYLEDADPRLKLSKEDLFKLYRPYLMKINPDFSEAWINNSFLFTLPAAQPVVDCGYRQKARPDYRTPLQNLFLITQAQVYPWDRGLNYIVRQARELTENEFPEVMTAEKTPSYDE